MLRRSPANASCFRIINRWLSSLVIGLLALIPVVHGQESRPGVIPDYERMTALICKERGQDYDGKRCVEHNSDRPTPDGSSASFVARNYGACDIKILIAYVPVGGTDYVVDGWWTARSGAHFTLNDERDRAVLLNPRFPTYFFIHKTDGRPVRNIPVHRDFSFQGKQYGFAQHGAQAIASDGSRWIEVICQP